MSYNAPLDESHVERIVDEGIAHLDFPVDDGPRHYAHPVRDDVYWCGAPRKSRKRPGSTGIVPVSKITCVDCLHLYIEKGHDWWWRVNRAYYES